MTTFLKRIISAIGYELNRIGTTVPNVDYRLMSYRNFRRAQYFKNLFDRIKDVPGDIVECGVSDGQTLSYLAYCAMYEGKHRKMWAFDTFKGLPAGGAHDMTPDAIEGRYGVGMKEVMRFLIQVGVDNDFIRTEMRFIPGLFKDTLDKYRGNGIALIHSDVDLYDSHKQVLEALYPKLVTGGIIAFDEYMGAKELPSWPGAHKAIDEYLGDDRYRMETDTVSGKFFLVKK